MYEFSPDLKPPGRVIFFDPHNWGRHPNHIFFLAFLGVQLGWLPEFGDLWLRTSGWPPQFKIQIHFWKKPPTVATPKRTLIRHQSRVSTQKKTLKYQTGVATLLTLLKNFDWGLNPRLHVSMWCHWGLDPNANNCAQRNIKLGLHP